MANAPQIKFQPQPANVAGIPRIISVAATGVNLQSRTFWGAGAPSSQTLEPGPQTQNPMYFAANLNVGPATPLTAPDLYLDTTNNIIYFCTTSGTNATSKWTPLSASGGSLAVYQVVSDAYGVAGAPLPASDYLYCQDPATLVKKFVRKPTKLRNSIAGETINGVNFAYTYAIQPNGYWWRTAAFSGLTEVQQIIPFYLPNDYLYTMPDPNAPGGAGFGIIDTNIDGRAWAAL